MKSFFDTTREYVIEFLKLVLISSAIIIPIRYFLIQPFYVKGASMEQSFYDKEYLIIDEFSYRFNAPERGDVVIFKYPKDPSQYFIKRVIGMPGETVEIKDGYVFLKDENGESKFLDESLYLNSDTLTYTDLTMELKEGEYFVLGDNREASLDSRVFGPLHEEFLIGKAWIRGWPFDRFGVIEGVEYPQ